MARFLGEVEKKIQRLAERVGTLGDEAFNERTRLDVHDLLCTIRLAIWEDKEAFVQWLDKKPHEINPGVLDRIILIEGKKDATGEAVDGVELRFHIFKDGSDTFRHNHSQDFITIPLKGTYTYTYYYVDNEADGEYREWERQKGGPLTEQPRKMGQIFSAKRGGGAFDLVPLEPSENVAGTLRGGDEPLFVHHKWVHTVNHIQEDGDMITFVVRRGYRHPRTRVISEVDEDATEGNEMVRSTKRGQVKKHEKERIQNIILEALAPHKVGGDHTTYGDLKHYMISVENLLRINKEDFDESPANKEICMNLLCSNGFTFLPLMKDEKCENFFSIDVFDPSKAAEVNPDSLEIDDHVLSALLWTIGSRKFVCPVKNKDGKLEGMFSLDDINDQRFHNALLLSLVSQESFEFVDEFERNATAASRVEYANKLFTAVEDLYETVFNTQDGPPNKEVVEALLHKTMLQLGPLITMASDLNLGRVAVQDEEDLTFTLGARARYPMFIYKVDDVERPNDLRRAETALRLIHKGGNYSQLALVSKKKTVMLQLETGIETERIISKWELKTMDSKTTLEEVLHEFALNPRPLFVRRGEELGIFSPYEFNAGLNHESLRAFVYRKVQDKAPRAQTELLTKYATTMHALSTQENEETEEAFHQFCKLLLS